MIHPRDSIRNLKAATHGGVQVHDLERLGLSRDEILDFSVSTNPFPPPSSVVEAARAVAIEAYPDSRARRLQEALAGHNGVSSAQIAVVNGTSQALWLIALAYLREGDEVLTFQPTYGDYETVSSMMGARTTELRTREEESFVPPMEEAVRLLKERPFRIVWLCNPNNPTSTYLSRAELEPLLETCRETETLLVLDEAYASFSMKRFATETLVEGYPLLLMRSMTKDFNLNALRLGYIVASEPIASVIDRVQPPWSVNTPAEEAGLMALKELDYYRESWRKTAELTQELGARMEELGFRRYPVGCNFQLFRGPLELDLAPKLWDRGMKIRECTSFGLPGFYRIGTRSAEQNDRLLSAVKAIYSMNSRSPR